MAFLITVVDPRDLSNFVFYLACRRDRREVGFRRCCLSNFVLLFLLLLIWLIIITKKNKIYIILCCVIIVYLIIINNNVNNFNNMMREERDDDWWLIDWIILIMLVTRRELSIGHPVHCWRRVHCFDRVYLCASPGGCVLRSHENASHYNCVSRVGGFIAQWFCFLRRRANPTTVPAASDHTVN